MSDLASVPSVAIEIGGRSDGQRVRGVKIGNWKDLNIERTIDSGADAFSFSVPWDPDMPNRSALAPFSTTVVEVFADDQRLISGYIELSAFQSDSGTRTLNIQGRSQTGVLLDWSAGPPFQFEGMTFNQIATQVAHPYTVRAVPDFGPLDDVQIEVGQSIYEFLAGLASANGRFGRPTAAGALEFVTFENLVPVADLIEGESSLKSISVSYDVTKLYNQYMVIAQSDGEPDISASAYDSRLPSGVRGKLINQPSQQSADYDAAARLLRSRAMIDSFSPNANVDGWKVNGQFWTPGTAVRVYAPGVYIIKPSKLVIRKARFVLDESGGQQTELELALPESLSNTYPEVVSWED